MAQYLRPDGSTTMGSWTGSYTAIDESSPDDSDYISTTTSGSYAKITLSNPSTPGSGNCVMRIRARAGTVTPARTLGWILVQNGSAKVTRTTSLTNAFATTSYTLSSGEVESITDWSALEIWIDVTGTGTNQTLVSWFEFEVPDAARLATLSATLAGIEKMLAATVAIAAAASPTLAGLAMDATVMVDVVAGMAATLAGLGINAAAEVSGGSGGSAELDATLADLGVSAGVGVTVAAAASPTLAGLAMAATVTVDVAAGMAASLAGLGISAAAGVQVTGGLAATLAGVGFAGQAELTPVTTAQAAIILEDVSCSAAVETTISAVLEQTLEHVSCVSQIFNPNLNAIESGYRCRVTADGVTLLSELPCNVYSVLVSTSQAGVQSLVLHDSLDPSGDPNPRLTLAFTAAQSVDLQFVEQIEFNIGLAVVSSSDDNRGYIQFGYA